MSGLQEDSNEEEEENGKKIEKRPMAIKDSHFHSESKKSLGRWKGEGLTLGHPSRPSPPPSEREQGTGLSRRGNSDDGSF